MNDLERKAVCISSSPPTLSLSQPRFQTTVMNRKNNFRLSTQSKTVQLPDAGAKNVKLSTLETAVDQIKEIVELEEVYQS